MRIPIEDEYKDYSEYMKNYETFYEEKIVEDYIEKDDIKGEIVVVSRLLSLNGTLLKSAKINLYMLTGLSPQLVASKISNENGECVFKNLKVGSYRVIAMLDKKYFEKPTYYKWNEVTLNEENKSEKIIIINKMKNYIKK